MGAKPLAFTLAVSLPEANKTWLAGFSQGMFALADQHQCKLIGGDTTKGPLNICITVFGEIPPGQALRRDSAQAGDDIWISGSLGDARLALAALLGEIALDSDAFRAAAERLHAPTPRVALGLALRGVAHAAIDISDGLKGDLAHILAASGLGASLNLDQLPAGPMLSLQSEQVRRLYALCGGDDYELCFTAAPSRRAEVISAAASSVTVVTRVGTIDRASGLRLLDAGGISLDIKTTSFDHFVSP
jgi:thiamine-monophosphate kinase